MTFVSTALKAGLKPGGLWDSLTKKPAKDDQDLLSRAEKYIRMEEMDPRRQKAPDREKEAPEHKKRGRSPERSSRRHGLQPRNRGGERDRSYVPLNASISQIFRALDGKGELARPSPIRTDPANRDQSRYCDYHRDHGHTTDQCRALRKDIDELIKRGRLREFVKQPGHQQQRGRERRRPDGQEARGNPRQNQGAAQRNVIAVITGESRYTGSSNRSRKRSAREASFSSFSVCTAKSEEVATVSFGEDDLRLVHLPHDDALVVTMTIGNHDVKRILVDNGSNVNVIFLQALNKMEIGHSNIEAMKGRITGFSGEVAHPVGKIRLPVTVGDSEKGLQSTNLEDFVVIDSPSPYNAIMGRAWLHDRGITPSSLHQCMKFVLGGTVVTVRGDQSASRMCHALSLKDK